MSLSFNLERVHRFVAVIESFPSTKKNHTFSFILLDDIQVRNKLFNMGKVIKISIMDESVINLRGTQIL
jgi:hypothetical protein